MIFNSTEEFLAAQNRAFEELKDVDKVLRGALFDSLALIKGRIQQDGQNSGGGNIGTYSKKWAKFRSSIGRQTGHIDLTLSGDMMRNFSIIPDGSDALGLGFTSDLESDKASGNEERYGGAIFELTSEEEAFIEGEINKKVADILNKAN
ncbi:MAG: hypothetical protein V4714_08250 [Bacteroidota bacterium]